MHEAPGKEAKTLWQGELGGLYAQFKLAAVEAAGWSEEQHTPVGSLTHR